MSNEVLASVSNSTKRKDPNFNKEVFEKKVQQHISCGYDKKLAEWKVMQDYNTNFFNKLFDRKLKNTKTDKNGYYC